MRRAKILAVASGGGHWEQLMLLRESFEGQDVVYATTMEGLAERFDLSASLVPDFNLHGPVKTIRGLFPILSLVLKVRPDVIISTGAAPGLVALLIGRFAGARTIWIDSVANAERLSLSGRVAGIFVDVWLTQWAHLARKRGPRFAGSVL